MTVTVLTVSSALSGITIGFYATERTSDWKSILFVTFTFMLAFVPLEVYLLPGLLGAGAAGAYLNYRTHQEILLLKVETALATGRQL